VNEVAVIGLEPGSSIERRWVLPSSWIPNVPLVRITSSGGPSPLISSELSCSCTMAGDLGEWPPGEGIGDLTLSDV
jgi:hypothetical protein